MISWSRAQKTIPAWTLAALVIGGTPLSGRGSESYNDPRPNIPSPGGYSRPVPRPAVKKPSIKPFPAKEINKLLAEGGYTRTRFLQERLRRILPPGSYKFDSQCPLIKRSPPSDPLTREYPTFVISCLDREHQAYLAVPVAPDKSGDVWKLLFQAPQGSKMTATLRLSLQKRRWDQTQSGTGTEGGGQYSDSGEIIEGTETATIPGYYNYVYHASTWLWKQRKIRFSNSFLRILYKNAARVHYDRYDTQDHFAIVLPDLLKEAKRRNARKKDDWRADFLAVIQPGRWLPFFKACPLELVRPPRRDGGDRRLRMQVRITCLGKGRFATTDLLLEENFFRNYPDFAPLPGTRFTAELKFDSISTDGRKYRLRWDTINNLRPL